MTELDPSVGDAQDETNENAAGQAEQPAAMAPQPPKMGEQIVPESPILEEQIVPDEPEGDPGAAAVHDEDAAPAENRASSEAVTASEEAAFAEEAMTAEGPGDDEEPATGESMRDFFQQLLNAMGVQGSVGVREDTTDQVTLDILSCPDASLIIGRHGQTVDDLQYLGSLILNNNRRDRKRFILNVENYRERREETLRRSAVELARQVAEFNQEAVLDPLPPHERRIVHVALVDMPDVYTYSEGEEPDRRIVISPRRVSTPATETSTPMAETAADYASTAGAASGARPTALENQAAVESEEAAMEESSEEAGLVDLPISELNESSASESHDVHQGTAGAGLGIPRAELGAEPDTTAEADALPETTNGGGSHDGHTGE